MGAMAPMWLLPVVTSLLVLQNHLSVQKRMTDVWRSGEEQIAWISGRHGSW